MTNAADLAELLVETGQHHHHAYIEADGADPEWAMWYAGYLQARIWDGFGTVPSRSRLIHLLLGAEEAHQAGDASVEWPRFYASYIAERLV